MQFDPSFFSGNRQRLTEKLPASLIVLTAHSELQKSRDIPYPFEQENNFWYLTGIDEPDWRLIIDGKNQKEYLVSPNARESRSLWDGTLSEEEAKAISGIDTIISSKELSTVIESVKKQYRKVYTLTPQTELREYFDFLLNPAPQILVRELKAHFKEVADCRPELSRLRGVKQQVEIEAIQKAIDISIIGIKAALGEMSAHNHEYEFEAELSKQFRLRGGQGHAFTPIAACGKNAYTIHYDSNNGKLNKNEWFLFDVGARFNRYCADIARAVPPTTPTKEQLSIYEAIRKVQSYAISLLVQGKSVEQYFQETEDAMGEQLLTLGLITEKTHDNIRALFPYAIGHGLGIDVHDPLGKVDVFEAGMIVTVEPGIHIADKKLGMRIEDDILITKDGPVVMTKDLPSDLEQLQSLVGKNR